MNQLDNPVWHSLNETHKPVCIDYPGVKFYSPEYCPFGGWESGDGTAKAIHQYASHIDNFFIVGERPALPTGIELKKEMVCLQMVIEKNIAAQSSDPVVALDSRYHHALFELVNLVQPGYFRPKTALLGDYFGIFKDDQLVAVSGERMKMNAYTEVSAVVTHPDCTGRGYARQLVAHGVNDIFRQNKIPFLHVVETNFHAISLYEKLGFRTRRKISFWNLSTH